MDALRADVAQLVTGLAALDVASVNAGRRPLSGLTVWESVMAEAKVKMQFGRVTLEVDASSVKDAVAKLSEYGEVFQESQCGRCGAETLAYEHRQHDGHDYYSKKCRACGAQLDFGQHRGKDTLFAKRKLANGDYDREHGGWYHWHERKPATEGGR